MAEVEGFGIVKRVRAGKLPAPFDATAIEKEVKDLSKSLGENAFSDEQIKKAAKVLTESVNQALPELRKDIDSVRSDANNANNNANNAINVANNAKDTARSAVEQVGQLEQNTNLNFTKVKQELVKVVTIEDSLLELGLLATDVSEVAPNA
jgi:methyl-accepting chemotaxis protein